MASDAGRTNTQTLSERIEAPRTRLVEPFLFMTFDADRPDGAVSRHALRDVDEVHLRRGPRREAFREQVGGRRRLILTFTDPRMSGVHAFIRRKGKAFVLEDARSKNGTLLDGRRVSVSELPGDCLIELGHSFLLFKPGAPVAHRGDPDVILPEPGATDPLSTLSTVFERTACQLGDVARSALPILVQGETGTGKEVVSRAIHRMSERAGCFVAVNCGGIPTSLVEAEVSGFRKGAFSGAVDNHVGFARAADGGTLFLDEIGDLPLAAQAAFLRVLQERKVVPIGAVSPLEADFRSIAATHRNLKELVSRGSFREDLLARLNAFTVELLPLRERLEDVGLLVARLLTNGDGGAPPRFTLDAARWLFRHSWPHNVRELEHRVRLGLVLARGGDRIDHEHLCPNTDDVAEGGAEVPHLDARTAATAPPLSPEDLARRDELIAMLRRHRGNVTAVAQAMGKARAQVQRWMRRYSVDRRSIVTG